MNFEDNLKTKKELRFKDGKFRILLFTDLHGKISYDRRTVKVLEDEALTAIPGMHDYTIGYSMY